MTEALTGSRPVGSGPGLALKSSRGEWRLTLWSQSREGGGCYVAPRRDDGGGHSKSEPDADRSATEAARRARAQVRRYCTAWRLNRLGTCTYRGDGNHDPVALRHDVAAFIRALRDALGGKSLPYLWVPEWHPGGHGLHLHFAVGRYIKRSLIEQSWPHGFVHIRLLSDLSTGFTAVEEARRTASYLAKYVGKQFDDRRVPGLHRYEVAQGFQPAKEVLRGPTIEQVLHLASDRLGSPPCRVWSSAEAPGWTRPPAIWAAWS